MSNRYQFNVNNDNTVLKIDYRNDRYKIYNGSRITRNDLFKINFSNYYASNTGRILLDIYSLNNTRISYY